MPPIHFLPKLVERGVHLAIGHSFDDAAKEMRIQHQVTISGEMLRRATEHLGTVQEQREQQEVARLHREVPLPTEAPDRLVMSTDGGMVAVRPNQWAEIKMVAIGEPHTDHGETHTTQISYFARLADAETFADQALGELHRRGVETAGEVEGVQDGAEWLQRFLDMYRPDAVRVLDFYHATERLRHISELLFGPKTAVAQRWCERKCHQLRHRGPDPLLDQLRHWEQRCAAIGEHVAYLTKRRDQMHYPEYAQQQWVLGSGTVESGHKHVWQARLTGAGRFWARRNVNPMLVLCVVEANGRWQDQYPLLRRQAERQHQAQRQERKYARHPLVPLPPPPSVTPLPRSTPPDRPKLAHPWRQYRHPLAS